MAHNDRLLRRICAEDETYLTAQPLLRLAQVRTGPGSGHDLGPHTVGLPAICAYIASKRLKNGDVTRTAAQQASCLKAADFEKAYYIVESVLGGARTKTTAGGELTYEELIKKYKIPMASERLVPWMKKAETKLVQADANLGEKQATRDVIGAVFLWVCSAIKGRKITPLQNFAEENRISLKSLKRIYDTLTTALAEFKAELLEAMKPKPRATSSSPTKRSQTVAGSSLQPIPALQLSPTKRSTSSTKQPLRPLLMKGGSPTKRRVTFSDADMTDETGTVTDGGSEVTPATTDVEMDADTDLDMDGGSVPASLSTLSRGSTMSISTIQDDSEADELFRGGSPTKMSQGDGLSTPRKRGRPNRVRLDLGDHEGVFGDGLSGPACGEDAMDVDPVMPSKKTPNRSRRSELQDDAETPRQSRQRSRKQAATPPIPPRRYRPIYTDFHQWNALDPRVEKVTKIRMELMESMMKKYGSLADRVLQESGMS